MEEKQRQQEVSRVFQWFAQNPSTVEDIRSEDGVVDMETALGVLEKLREDNGVYDSNFSCQHKQRSCYEQGNQAFHCRTSGKSL